MDLADFAKSLGLPGLVVLIWYLLEKARIERTGKSEDKKTEAMSVGFQSLSGKLEAHATEDAEHHADRKAELAEIRGRLDMVLDITPVESSRHRTNPQGVPAGYYGPRRPGTKDDR